MHPEDWRSFLERLSLPRRISESTRKPERLSAPDLRYWLRTPGIAGGFGSQLDIAKAAGAGLIPEKLAERVHILGNAVIAGLCVYIQRPDQEGIRRMIQHTREISLAKQPKFTKTFLDFSCF